MKVPVFLSWSGELSRGIASTLKDWLTRLVHVHPFFSEDDIAKGRLWRDEVSRELELNSVGILVLTPDNVAKPSSFMLFEAGALSKLRKDARVFTLLVDVKPSDVRIPLDGFQHTLLEREDFRKLVQQVNELAGDGDRRDPQQLNDMFDEAWPRLEASVRNLQALRPAHTEPAPQRNADDMIEEVLLIAREIRDRPRARFLR
jgi:TIR domain